jgi:D-alanyl-D-alanine carboxypeptidase
VHFLRPSPSKSPLNWLVVAAVLAVAVPAVARAEALLVVDAESGIVREAENATIPWYPASVTKLMTAYVTLTAVKEGRITLDTLLTVSPVAASQSPSKMGFRPGTQVTVDNALKMMLVKSANDMAVVLAEGVGGSIDGFSAQMNAAAQKLGMTQTSYVNPNGLPADGQITSARDLAILARGIIHDLPEYEYFVHIPSIRYGRKITQNFNRLIGRYPGADGFKTGFICASGYNLVASATRNGRRLIAVVLGASSGTMRAVRAAQLLDRHFNNSNPLSWLQPSLGLVNNLPAVDASPPNLRDEMCGGKHHRRPASDEDEETIAGNGPGSSSTGGESSTPFFTAGLQPPMPKPSELLAAGPAASEPIPVYTGPTKSGPALIAAVAVDSERQTPARHGKKSRVAAAKPATEPQADGKDTKPVDAKPVAAKRAVRHANAKPDAAAPKVAEKPAVAADKPPAAPKPSAKPKSAAKPKSTTDTKPTG